MAGNRLPTIFEEEEPDEEDVKTRSDSSSTDSSILNDPAIVGVGKSRPIGGTLPPFSTDLGDVSDGSEGEDDWTDYWDQRSVEDSSEKSLVPKSHAFEVLIKVKAEDLDQAQVIVVCNRYQPETANPVRGVHKPREYIQQLKEGFQAMGPSAVTNRKEMHPSSVIGWCNESSVYFVNKTDLEGPADDEVIPLSDTLFPVFVMGPKEMPVTLDVIDRYLPSYELGLYLILESDSSVQSFRATVSVYKKLSIFRSNVSTQRAQLALYMLYLIPDTTANVSTAMYRSMGFVDRILDCNNPSFCVYGMYAGGELPSFPKRLSWDQPRDPDAEDFGHSSLYASFRCETSYKKNSQRVGYFCSKDSLLFVTERRTTGNGGQTGGAGGVQEERALEYRSLLKYTTYVIVDGYSEYHLYYTNQAIQEAYPLRLEGTDKQLTPLIVVVSEGLSSVTIIERKEVPMTRNSWYYHHNPQVKPILLDWRQFQQDFSSKTEIQRLFERALNRPPQRPPQRTATGPEPTWPHLCHVPLVIHKDPFPVVLSPPVIAVTARPPPPPPPLFPGVLLPVPRGLPGVRRARPPRLTGPTGARATVPPLPGPGPTPTYGLYYSDDDPNYGEIQQIMDVKAIRDYTLCYIKKKKRQYLFSLKKVPFYNSNTGIIDNCWHVFCRLRPQTVGIVELPESTTQLYYYLGSIQIRYAPDPSGTARCLMYSELYFTKQFEEDIDADLVNTHNISWAEQTDASEMAEEFKNIRADEQFKEFLWKLHARPLHKFRNTGHMTPRRLEIINGFTFTRRQYSNGQTPLLYSNHLYN